MMEDDETYYIIIDGVQEVDDFVIPLHCPSPTERDIMSLAQFRFLSSDVVTEFTGRRDRIHINGPCRSESSCQYTKGTQEEDWSGIQEHMAVLPDSSLGVMTRRRISFVVCILLVYLGTSTSGTG